MSTSCVSSLAVTAGVRPRELSARRHVADGAFNKSAMRGAGRRADRVTSGTSRLDVTATSMDTNKRDCEDRRARLTRGVVAATAALALALAPAVRAEDAAEMTSSPETETSVSSESSSEPSPKSAPSENFESLEVVEIPFDDVAVGDAPDIEARKQYTADLQKRGISEQEAKAIENNQKIKQYNNAPEEFPTFVREGYDVRVITTEGFVTQDDGLVYKDFVKGTGQLPTDGQEVTFEYIAYNENGGTIDSTYRKGVPASTRLGINGMIPGFEEGLKGMRSGGKRRVVVPPELGPPTGPATFFSAKQWEVFDIELLEVKNCSRVQSSFMSSSVVCE